MIKQQAISAYDPRVVEATGITMMVLRRGRPYSRQCAKLDCTDMTVDEVSPQLGISVSNGEFRFFGVMYFWSWGNGYQREFVVMPLTMRMVRIDGRVLH
ncbi:MAG: hypothetical protein CM1200mP18_12510 [Gammaproteobacteria bacterium]|nr:MAG: hypothetical protein CM1200mP18_12510 [Gammaproteobacteria bacterium]